MLRFELETEAYALLTEALRREKGELGPGATDSQAITRLLDKTKRPADDGVAPNQVAYTICTGCERASLDTSIERVEVRPEVGERAACDAKAVPLGASCARAGQTVRPSVRRAVSAEAERYPLWDLRRVLPRTRL